MKPRFSTLRLVLLLSSCFFAASCGSHDSSSLSDQDATTSLISTDTYNPYVPPLNCDVNQIDRTEGPYQGNESDLRADLGGFCIGSWLLTFSTRSDEFEGFTIWAPEDGVWKKRNYLWALCWNDDEEWYGQSRKQDALTSLKLIQTQFDCNGGPGKTYHPEPESGSLKFGDTGKRVKALQVALLSKSFLSSTEDVVYGRFGPETVRAVMNFQYSTNLVADGVAGAQTHNKLKIQYHQSWIDFLKCIFRSCA